MLGFLESGGFRADEVDLEVYFGVVLGFTLDLPTYLTHMPQVDLSDAV